jgi:hypothetical protein
MAPLLAKYRSPGQPNQGGSTGCDNGCPLAPPAAPAPAAPGAPGAPTNAGNGTGGPGQTGGSGGAARLTGAGELTNPDGTPLAGGDRLRNLLNPTQSPGAARGPPTVTETLLGQPNPARTGPAFYGNLLGADGAAAARLRSLGPDQIQQLTSQGPPRTAQDVLTLATGTQPAPAGTVGEWDRQQAIKQWFADSRNHPADFDTFAAALPETERAKLNQAFEDNKPGQLSQPGGLTYWGRQTSKTLTSIDDWSDRNLGTGHFTPGSWQDRWDRSARNFIEGVPAGAARAVDDLLAEDEARSGNPHFQPLAGESAEHADQRLHPFTQDLKDQGKTYTDELGPAVTRGDFSQLGSSFHDDPVGTLARYVPFGQAAKFGAVRGASKLAETGAGQRALSGLSDTGRRIGECVSTCVTGLGARRTAARDLETSGNTAAAAGTATARGQSLIPRPVGARPTAAASTRPGGRPTQRPVGAAGTGPGRPTGIVGRRPGDTDEPTLVTAGGNKPLTTAGGSHRPAGNGQLPLAASTAKPGRTENLGEHGAGASGDHPPPLGGQGATQGPSPRPAEDPDSAAPPGLPPGGGHTAHHSSADTSRTGKASSSQPTVEEYLGRSDVRHALTRASETGKTVTVDNVEQPVAQVIADRLPHHPGLVQALSTADDLHSSLLTRPKAFANLLTHPQAATEFEASIADLNRLGPERLLDRAQAAPGRQPITLNPVQRGTVDGLRNSLRDLPRRERVQDGFDETRTEDQTYLRGYLAESKAKADDVQPQLTKIAQTLAGRLGGEPGWRTSPKDDTRAMDKINDPDGARGDASQLVDLAGAKVEFDSINKVYQALEQARQLPDVKIVRFKDRLVEPQKSGYGDLLLNLRMSNGHVGELRLQLAPAERISTDYEHALYESARDLESHAKSQGRELTTRDDAFTEEILRRTNSLYEDAFAEGSSQ